MKKETSRQKTSTTKKSSEQTGTTLPASQPAGDTTHKWQPGDLVIYKNNQLIAFNKPAGIPVQADKTGDKSLLQLGEIFCKSRLFPIHRLDRPVSGIVLFAKSSTAATSINEQFKSRTIRKRYLAVVKNPPPETSGKITHFIRKDGAKNKSLISDQPEPGSSQAELSYRLLGSSDNYHLLEVELLTGRHHQIRAQLAALGCPVKGDVKYGARRSNADRSIHLHAWKLSFQHPVSAEEVLLSVPPPEQDPVWAAFRETLQQLEKD